MKDLTVFCAKERTRYSLETPFVVNGYEYFSDGRICIKRKTDKPNTPDKAPDFESIFIQASESPIKIPVAIEVPDLSNISCLDCMGTGTRHTPCSMCGGSGEHDCDDCRSIHECGICEGDGRIGDYSGEPCVRCDKKRKEYENITMGGVRFKGYYIGLICKTLANPRAASFAKICHTETNIGPMRFTFVGGEGVLMSIKKD